MSKCGLGTYTEQNYGPGMAKCGIYWIEHIASGRVYVGSSGNISRRWTVHKGSLRAGKHHTAHLQRAWLKHGEAAFSFAVIEEVEAAFLAERETHHIAINRSTRGVYNTAPVGGSTLGLKLGPHSAEHRAKIGEAQKGKKLSEEHRRLISQVHKGKTLSAQHRAALIESVRTRIHSDETRAKLSERARNITDDTRRKRSASVRASMTEERRQFFVEHGRNISEETRRKRSEAVRQSWIARKAQSGSK